MEVGGSKNAPAYLLILVHPTLCMLPRPLPGALLSCFGKKVSKEADQGGASSKGAPLGFPRRLARGAGGEFERGLRPVYREFVKLFVQRSKFC